MTTRLLQRSTVFLLIYTLAIFHSNTVHAVGKNKGGVSEKVKELLAQGVRPNSHKIFGNERDHNLDQARGKAFSIDKKALKQLKNSSSRLVSFKVPTAAGTISLVLFPHNVFSSDFVLSSSSGKSLSSLPRCFRGIVGESLDTLASVCVDDHSISGIIKHADKVVELSALQNGEGVTFDINQVPNPAETPEGNDAIEVPASASLIPNVTSSSGSSVVPTTQASNPISGVGARPVKIYLEADYDLFVRQSSSLLNASNYIISFFNQVSTLYANENVAIEISGIKIWDTLDPYSNLSISDILYSFRSNLSASNWNGDLAHFITGRSVGGGIAFVNVLGNRSYAFGVSYVQMSYANVPTYSWTVEVVSHELGHNLGSNHTHNCGWQGGALDNCYAPEGSCSPGPAPTNGGTVMSYCHISSYGINFANGFGLQPGNKIRERVVAVLGANPNPGGNMAPVVNAGADKNLPYLSTEVVLNGSAYDPDGQIVSVLWSKVSGPSADLAGTNTLNLSISNLVSGSYVFRLTATDDKGLSASDDVIVVVAQAPVPQAPVVSAGRDKSITLPTNSITISGTAYDNDGTIVSVSWSQVSGPSQATMSGQNTLNLTASDLISGNYTFRLTATDNQGLSSSDDVVVKVGAQKGKGGGKGGPKN